MIRHLCSGIHFSWTPTNLSEENTEMRASFFEESGSHKFHPEIVRFPFVRLKRLAQEMSSWDERNPGICADAVTQAELNEKFIQDGLFVRVMWIDLGFYEEQNTWARCSELTDVGECYTIFGRVGYFRSLLLLRQLKPFLYEVRSKSSNRVADSRGDNISVVDILHLPWIQQNCHLEWKLFSSSPGFSQTSENSFQIAQMLAKVYSHDYNVIKIYNIGCPHSASCSKVTEAKRHNCEVT